jgi:hypothetical protein
MLSRRRSDSQAFRRQHNILSPLVWVRITVANRSCSSQSGRTNFAVVPRIANNAAADAKITANWFLEVVFIAEIRPLPLQRPPAIGDEKLRRVGAEMSRT